MWYPGKHIVRAIKGGHDSDWYPGRRIAQWVGLQQSNAEHNALGQQQAYADLLNNPELAAAHREMMFNAGEQAARQYDPAWQLLAMQTGGKVQPPNYDQMFEGIVPDEWDQLRGRRVG